MVRDQALPRDASAPPELQPWLAPVSPFIASQNLETLKRELGRYVRGEVDGRSFLIAGHRGSGKTSLVRRAIEDFRQEILRNSLLPPPGEAPSLQRPMIVKLHGPSLLATPKPDHAGGSWPKPGGVAGDPEEVTLTFRPGSGAATAKADPDAPPSESTAQTALIQITIALYRALAREAAETYAVHAREQQRLLGGDQTEVAGQLVLELDRAPEPSVLRAFWARLERLAAGVFWPLPVWRNEISATSQGLREVLALATAAQAFQTCAGDVTEARTDTGSASREEVLATSAALNLAPWLNRVAGLAVGGAAGTVLSLAPNSPSPWLVVAGAVAAGLVTSLTLEWSSRRQATRREAREYSFILDRSRQSLERDLPLVIERVRAAGLAPVFVVDELDKLRQPELEVADIIGKLKHLITDFGFFCFLTDRRYYEYVTHEVQVKPFPQEHTFFSDHIFVLYRPDELRNFLNQIIVSDLGVGSNDDEFAKRVLTLCLLHRAKLNTVDLVREISRQTSQGGAIRLTPDQVRSPANQLIATVQLAVEHVLATLANRMAEDPMFAQLAVDALYRMSREWENQVEKYEPGRPALLKYLAGRIGLRPKAEADKTDAEPAEPDPTGADPLVPEKKPEEKKAPPTPEQIVQQVVGPVEIEDLVDAVERFESYMENFVDFETALRESGSPAYEVWLDLRPASLTTGLIKRTDDGGYNRFLFNVVGTYLQDRPDEAAITARANGAIEGLETLCKEAGVTPDLLVEFGLLPQTIAWTAIAAAAATVASPTSRSSQRNDALSQLERFVGVLQPPTVGQARARRIAEVLRLVRAVAIDAGLANDRRPVLVALARYLDLRSLVENVAQPLSNYLVGAPAFARLSDPVADLGESLRLWGERLALDPPSQPKPDLGAGDAWVRWRTNVAAYVSGSAVPPALPAYDDIVCAAAGRGPGALFRPQLAQMTVYDWSAVALSALQPDAPGPRWAALAALRTLGFGRAPVEAVQRLPGEEPGRNLNLEQPFLPPAPTASPPVSGAGALVLTVSEPSVWDAPPVPERPLLAVPLATARTTAAAALAALAQCGLFETWSVET